MDDMITFMRAWFDKGYEYYRRGDPLLMGAAIAFNSLFALVPIGIAFVAILGLVDQSGPLAKNVIEVIESTLPPEIGMFIIDILNESSSALDADRLILVVVSILIALWSGSRAVYAIQKSLRLVQGEKDERGYLRSRLVGIGVTVAAIIAVLIGYLALAIGDSAWQGLADLLRIGSVSMTQFLLVTVVFLWAFSMLWAVYQFGPPHPIDYSGIVAACVAIVLLAGTALISALLPRFDAQAIAIFGSLGVILLWLYFIGIVVVAFPIVALSLHDTRLELQRQ